MEVQTNNDLQLLIAKGKAQGYLTYDEVNAYLPDEDVNPEKLDSLLSSLEELGIELVEEALDDTFDDEESRKSPTAEELQGKDDGPELLSAEDTPKLSDDPIRMYLSQMAVIPLLT